jgi:hypothetical protein
MSAGRKAGLREKAHPRIPNIVAIRKEGRSFVRKHGWLQTDGCIGEITGGP